MNILHYFQPLSSVVVLVDNAWVTLRWHISWGIVEKNCSSHIMVKFGVNSFRINIFCLLDLSPSHWWEKVYLHFIQQQPENNNTKIQSKRLLEFITQHILLLCLQATAVPHPRLHRQTGGSREPWGHSVRCPMVHCNTIKCMCLLFHASSVLVSLLRRCRIQKVVYDFSDRLSRQKGSGTSGS